MNDATLQILTWVVGSGGVVTGIVAFFRMRSDNARTTVSAAEGAVIVQSGVITSLREENLRLHEECARYREERDELRELLKVIDERRTERLKEGQHDE